MYALKSFLPINNLMTISNILERLALGYLKPNTTSSRNYCALLSAYQAAHLTKTAFVRVVDNILRNVDSISVVALVHPDISAAFDTINHDTLLRQL